MSHATPDIAPTEPLRRIPTGVRGFEHISLGGLDQGRTTLVVGTSGSGKTLFATEVLYRTIVEQGRNAVFVTFEERPGDVVRNVHRLGWDLPALLRDGRLVILDASMDRAFVEEAGDYDLSGIVSQVGHAVAELGAELVVIDSLGALFYQFQNPAILRREIARLCDNLREMRVTSLLTAERLEEYGPISRFGFEEFVSDCCIVLRHQLVEEKVRRTIQIYKLRGDRHYKDEFPFTIEREGICILPLAAAELTQASSTDRISFGSPALDEMAGGGLFQDSVILVSGPTGSGKTLLGTTFASEACRRGERVLLLGYEESRPQLARNALSWGVDFEEWERQGLLRMVCQYPEAQGLEGHLYAIQREVDRFLPRRLVVDSVSALERAGNVRNFREFVIGLTSLVKRREMCSLLTSSSPRLSGGDSITDAHISTITDAILLLRYVERNGALDRGVMMIKMRGSQHDKRFHEFTIDGSGLHIGEPFPYVPNGLLGVPSAGGDGRE
ncbi:Circadian clock protein kinase KaiC (plasmid) [Aquisphaera giovannonii]|uniref:non-specific serine/threonine protein kinase n=1 Tax=Aquisphaera giovannonii TaxID=406548 RepID=A0A5B9WH46_9BACT|nr:circadian clock protein KaiC [Aquisphaera giovannonii]QEH39261.1 Circadian clock protein kinase KaiC [Aquisphaera giovannonii]